MGRKTSLEDRLFRNCHSWSDFTATLGLARSTKEKGDPFERLVQLYLQIDPKYRVLLRHVWLYNDVPQKVRDHLRLPERDKGIDLVAETKTGQYWVVQAKYRTDAHRKLTFRDLSTFAALAHTTCRNVSYALICTTTDRIASELEGQPSRIGVCTSEVWESLDLEFFRSARAVLASRAPNLKRFRPRTHQRRAIKAAAIHYKKKRNTRGKMIHPCGSGKTLTSFWISQELKARVILVAVPSIALIRQTLNVWIREAAAIGLRVDWLCVCSDETAGKLGQDEFITHAYELGVPCVTRPVLISSWLREHRRGTRILFTTYQSGKAVATASRREGVEFDLAIMDEAHKTVGAKDKRFGHLLNEKNIRIRRRVFMTATERRYRGASQAVLSMDDPEVYGDTFDLLTFRKAIDAKPPILCDYEVHLISVGEKEISDLVEARAFVKPDRGNWKDIDAETLAAVVALRKAMKKFRIKHAVSFHRSIGRAKEFRVHNDSFSTALPSAERIDTYHVSGKLRMSERTRVLDEFSRSNRALVTNARCLSEGVDIPEIDGVIFADPKRSAVDIVQAAGRALRPSVGKKKGHIVVPVLVKGDANEDSALHETPFNQILSVLAALATNDERIIEEFRDISNGKRPRNRIVRLDGRIGETLAADIDLESFQREVELRVWARLARLGWREFNEARELARSIGLRNQKEYFRWVRGELRGKPAPPKDVPGSPDRVYAERGWKSWGDWLGTRSRQFVEWREFEAARDFVQKLNLSSQKEWHQWWRGQLKGKPARPWDIPGHPHIIYGEKGWKGYGDWLGTGTPGSFEWRSFPEARKFARALGPKSSVEWQEWVSGNLAGKPQRPSDIPSNPGRAYRGKGWISWSDWLGVTTRRGIEYRSFRAARKFIRPLGLSSQAQYWQWCRGNLKGKPARPQDIPTNPNRTYKDKGWKGYGDYLGTGNPGAGDHLWRDFRKARAFVRALEFTGQAQYFRWAKGELRKARVKPRDIPAAPSNFYVDKGWVSWGDWLGTQSVAPGRVQWREFKQAREFVQSLGLRNVNEHTRWAKGELRKARVKPRDIPAAPANVYADKGWKGFGDYLGTGTPGNDRLWRDFSKARAFVRALGLSGKDEYSQWAKGELRKARAKPQDIPATPQNVYVSKGWKNWRDWLGTE